MKCDKCGHDLSKLIFGRWPYEWCPFCVDVEMKRVADDPEKIFNEFKIGKVKQ